MQTDPFRCPVCKTPMPTNNPNYADHVALGEVVCSLHCHALMYEGDDETTTLYLPGLPRPVAARQLLLFAEMRTAGEED